MTVPFPAPEGPEITNTEEMASPAEVREQLAALPLGEPADGLAGADAALFHDARRLDLAALRRRHQEVRDLGGEQVLRRFNEDVPEARRAALEVGLERRPAAADLIGPGQRVHALVERTLGGRIELLRGGGHRAEVYVRRGGQFNSIAAQNGALSCVFGAPATAGRAGSARQAHSARPRASAGVRRPRAASSARSSPRMRRGASKAVKLAAPTATAVAPQAMNSRASRPLMTPPIPTTGTCGRASATSATMRSAIGLIAGPQRPPVRLPRNGLSVSRSRTIALNVLTSDIPSDPASTAARATAVTSLTLGVSLVRSRRRVSGRTAPTTAAEAAGSAPC